MHGRQLLYLASYELLRGEIMGSCQFSTLYYSLLCAQYNNLKFKAIQKIQSNFKLSVGMF